MHRSLHQPQELTNLRVCLALEYHKIVLGKMETPNSRITCLIELFRHKNKIQKLRRFFAKTKMKNNENEIYRKK